jgi:hypothetical protein
MTGTPGADPIEIVTDHVCLLGDVTDHLAAHAADGDRGEALAVRARDALADLLDHTRFAACCLPAYLALAPERFEREIQLPIACATAARLDTRVLLWPVGANDAQHPHYDGWAAFMAAQGWLTVSEQRYGVRLPERSIDLRAPELIFPEDRVSHHIHNVGDEVGLTIHVFGT